MWSKWKLSQQRGGSQVEGQGLQEEKEKLSWRWKEEEYRKKKQRLVGN
jgi:hypothetical protein